MKVDILSQNRDFLAASCRVLNIWSETVCVDIEIEESGSWNQLPQQGRDALLFVDADTTGDLREWKKRGDIRDAYGAVFICSADPQKAIECYDLRPAVFLAEPFSAMTLERGMKRCVAQWQCAVRCLELTESRSRLRLPICEIFWIEASGRGCLIHTARREIVVGESITQLAEMLPQELFVRCQRSFLANLHYVNETDGKFYYMMDGTSVPIGRGNRADAIQALERYQSLWNWDGEN